MVRLTRGPVLKGRRIVFAVRVYLHTRPRDRVGKQSPRLPPVETISWLDGNVMISSA